LAVAVHIQTAQGGQGFKHLDQLAIAGAFWINGFMLIPGITRVGIEAHREALGPQFSVLPSAFLPVAGTTHRLGIGQIIGTAQGSGADVVVREQHLPALGIEPIQVQMIGPAHRLSFAIQGALHSKMRGFALTLGISALRRMRRKSLHAQTAHEHLGPMQANAHGGVGSMLGIGQVSQVRPDGLHHRF
jgi:hypothetical protein